MDPFDGCSCQTLSPTQGLPSCICLERVDLFTDLFCGFLEGRNSRLDFGSGQTDKGGRIHPDIVAVLSDTVFGDVVEEGFQRVEVLLGEGVIFVVVTPCAVEGLAEPHGGGGFDPIGGVFG